MLKRIIEYIRTHNIFRHLLYIIATFLAVIIVVTIWMGRYTQHGEAVRIPDIKGLTVSAAAELLRKESLNYEVIDSLYDTSLKPGIIVEHTPRDGSSVKRNRTVYIVINSVLPQRLPVPDMSDVSSRQAQSLLEGLGFPSPDIVYLPSRYKDLVVGVSCKGRSIAPGEKLPITSKLQLFVGSGEEEILSDSLDSIPKNPVDDELFDGLFMEE